MKKQIVISLLIALVILTTFATASCKKNDDSFTPPETDAPFYGYTNLTLTKDPVIDSEGRIILYFEEKVYYTANTETYIGLMSQYSAKSVKATLGDAFEDMKVENGLVGMVIQPETALPTGAYTFSVTVGNRYMIEFNYIVE